MLDEMMLINLVKENPILYNSSHKNYMDVGMKVTVWNEIGAQMNSDGERCKQRWNNIRDNYRKSLRKLNQHKSMKPYRFAWQLDFLRQFVDEREPKGIQNLPVAEEKTTDDDESKSQSQPEVFKEETTHEDSNSNTTPGCEVVINAPTSQSGPVRKKKIVRESPSTVLMKYLLEKKSAQGTVTQPTACLEHPVDAFLFALSPSLKSLPSHLLTLAKSEIFASVQKYEMMQHTSKGNSTTAMNNMDMEASMDEEEEEHSHGSYILGTTERKISTGEYQEFVSVRPLSSLTPHQPPLKKQKQSGLSHNELLKSACELLSSCCKQPEETTDEYQAKLWTFKLKELVSTQKKIAERAINEILFEADLGTLHRNSVQINNFRDTTPLTTPQPPDLSAVESNSVTGSQPPATRTSCPPHSSISFNNSDSFSKTRLDD